MIEKGKELVMYQPPIRDGKVERISRKRAPGHYNCRCIVIDFSDYELRVLAHMREKLT